MSIFFKSYSHLLYSTGNSAQYSVILRNGKRTWKIIDICICITESLTCTPEVEWSESHLVVSDSLRPPGLYSPWDSPGQNTGVGSLSLLRGIFPTEGIEPRSPTLQADALPSEPPGKPNNTGVGSLSLLQEIFLTQESNQGLLHCRWILYQMSY